MRKLALCLIKEFNFDLNNWVNRPEPVWKEVHKLKGKWELWCGKEGVRSSESFDIIQLEETPEVLK